MTQELTPLLLNWAAGDKAAFDKLMPLVYGELRRLARQQTGRERPNHTLHSAALVNEVYVRLVDQRRANWQNRAQFFAVAARIMRRILVDYARRRQCIKRGGIDQTDCLSEGDDIASGQAKEIVAIDDALAGLASIDERKAQIVELRYFVGLNVEETAGILGLSPRTVMREWGVARAWLHRTLNGNGNCHG